jgi:hypothetical protein
MRQSGSVLQAEWVTRDAFLDFLVVNKNDEPLESQARQGFAKLS